MRRLTIGIAIAAFFAILPAGGGEPTGSPSRSSQRDRPTAGGIDEFTLLAAAATKPPDGETVAPIPSAAYSTIWQPQRQEEIGLSDQQKQALLAVKARASAEANDHVEQFKRLPPEEQKAQVASWGGRPAPWRQQLDDEVRRQIEAVLTPQQLQNLKTLSFPGYAVQLLCDPEVRQKIGMSPKQEDRLRAAGREILTWFQEGRLDLNEKVWALLTPPQQAAVADVVKRQGPTSAVLAICMELGPDFNKVIPDYPMLAELPVRKHLGLTPEQERQLEAAVADTVTKLNSALQEEAGRPPGKRQMSFGDVAAEGKRRVEAILTPQQLRTLGQIDFHRKVVLALGYPEKRQAIAMSDQQTADYQRLVKETDEAFSRSSHEIVGVVLQILTPDQREQLRGAIEQRGW